MIVDKPGIYEDLDEATYHRDPVPGGSLSHSGAKKLLPPSCPAKFAYEREHPPASKAAFDFGKAAHLMVLGDGAPLWVVQADNWLTKDAKAQRAEAREAGMTPILAADHETVKAMAKALRDHPLASALLDPDSGMAEQSIFWHDQRTGIMRRARLDWLRDDVSDRGRLIVPDYKSAVSAARDDFEKAAYNYGYVGQAPWYVDAVEAVGLAEQAVFVFVVQEKTAPFLVNVVELSAIAMDYGRDLNRQAIDTYVRCTEENYWPGYSDEEPDLISLPAWVERAYMEAKAA